MMLLHTVFRSSLQNSFLKSSIVLLYFAVDTSTVFLLQYLFYSLSMLLRKVHSAPFHILNILHAEILK